MIEFIDLKELDDDHAPSYGRGYLGYSAIGSKCLRSVIYEWLFVKKTHTAGRMQRIFDMGHYIEAAIVDEIKNRTTCELKHTGKDQLEVVGLMGHWKGHPDGILITVGGVKYLLEIKSMKQSSFNSVTSKGMKKAEPGHYDQVQAYMSFYDIPDQCVYIAVCKDSSEIYVEIIDIDWEHIETLRERQESLLYEQFLPSRVGPGRPTYWLCKCCDYKDVCWKDELPDRNCRTCANFVIADQGKFKCKLGDGNNLPLAFQKIGCTDKYVLNKEYFGL